MNLRIFNAFYLRHVLVGLLRNHHSTNWGYIKVIIEKGGIFIAVTN